MNTPRKSPSNSESSKERKVKMSRAIICSILAVGIFVSGYLTKGWIDNLSKKDSVADKSKDAGVKKQPSLKDKISALREVKSWEYEDTEVCSLDDIDPDDIVSKSEDITDERNEQKANELIAKLGITNENDKNAIIDAFLKGYVTLYDVIEYGIGLYKDGPESIDYDYVDLEEGIEVPPEFQSEGNEISMANTYKTEMEEEFSNKIDNGDFEGAVQLIDADGLIEEMKKEGIEGAYLEGVKMIKSIQEGINQGLLPEQMRLLLCQYILNTIAFSYIDDGEYENVGKYKESIRRNDILSEFFDSTSTFGIFGATLAIAQITGTEAVVSETGNVMSECVKDIVDINWRNMFEDFNNQAE